MNSRRFIRSPRRRGRAAGWHFDAERLSGLEVDDQLELCRLHHRQVGGLLALKNAASVDAGLPITVKKIGAVAHQAPRYREFALLIDRRNAMACRQRRDVIAPTEEERVGGNQPASPPRVFALSSKTPRRFHALCATRTELQSQAPGSFEDVLGLALGRRIARVDECGNHRGCWNHVAEELEPLSRQRGGKQVDPGDVAPRAAKLATRPSPTGSLAVVKTIGMLRVAAIAAQVARSLSRGDDNCDLRLASSAAIAGNRSD